MYRAHRRLLGCVVHACRSLRELSVSVKVPIIEYATDFTITQNQKPTRYTALAPQGPVQGPDRVSRRHRTHHHAPERCTAPRCTHSSAHVSRATRYNLPVMSTHADVVLFSKRVEVSFHSADVPIALQIGLVFRVCQKVHVG